MGIRLPVDLSLTDPDLQRLILTLLVILTGILLGRLGQLLIIRYTEEPEKRYRWNRLLRRLIALVVVLTVLAIWVSSIRTILAVLTIFGAGLVIAMRESVLSFMGWIYLMGRAPYRPGDRIQIRDIKGDVLDVRLLHTVLMEIENWVDGEQSTGRLAYIPNFWVFQHRVMNYTQGFRFIWNEISVVLTFRSDWEAAREIMLNLAGESARIIEHEVTRELRQMSHEFLVHFSILSPFVFVRIVPNGIKLTLRYLCEARKRRGTEHALTVSMLMAFREHGGIELAYSAHHLAELKGPQFGPIPETPS